MTDVGLTGRDEDPGGNGDWFDLRLFVANNQPRCVLAYQNLKAICKKNLKGKCRITVIDLVKEPEVARREQITAVPTLMRAPFVTGSLKIVGTLSDQKKVLDGLRLPARGTGTGREPERVAQRTG